MINTFRGLKVYLPDLIRITNVFLLSAVVLYGYFGFFTREKLEFIYRNWDGPGYVVVARTLYDVQDIQKVNPFPFLAPSHYAFQFPLYPVFIRIFSFLGYNGSMIVVSQLFTLAFSMGMYFLVKTVNPKANALMVAILSLFYTPRWFIVSHVGSNEPQFLFFITMFMLFFYKKQYLTSAVFASLAQLTKPQGILFFIGIALYYLFKTLGDKRGSAKENIKAFLPYLLIPGAIILVFTVYYFRFGDFFIFLSNEAFPTMQWPPLKILTSKTVYGALIDLFVVWKEAIVYTYLIYFVGIALLWEKRLYMYSVVALTYFLPVLLFVQTDMARFILPILPFVFLGLSDALSKKSVYTALLIATPMVFLYAVGYINYNLAPYPATLFLR